jgi:hypothetical protein
MPEANQEIDQILDKLIRDVESSVHAFYRGDVRQHTARVKTDTVRAAARQALLPLVGGGSPTPAATPVVPSTGLTPDEVTAITRCIMTWLPMGAPSSMTPESRCVPAGRELAPTWDEREKARAAIRRFAT